MNKDEKLEQFNDILAALNLPRIEVTDKPKYTLRKEGTQIVDRTKQEAALDQVRQGGFIVGSIDTIGSISFSSNPVVHSTATQARAECARLARIHPGKAFVFVKLAGAEMVPTATISI